ncbi:MAG: hypothetical protein HY866_21285 [Chloroflexi bacterium]|nr:hypothetical protein [Chloroflexota bacterium]
MSFKVEQISGEPIITITLYPDFNFSEENALSVQAMLDLLNAASQPSFLLIDMQASPDLGQIVVGADLATRGPNPLMHHKNVRQVLVATTDDLIAQVSRGLASQLFGHVNIEVFPTMNDALRYARSQP